MNMTVRQGDVLIEQIDDKTAIGQSVDRESGRIVLAHGEATGHAHAILGRGAALYRESAEGTPMGRVLRVTAKLGVDLVHEEHATVHLPPGTYRVTQQREWTGEDERQVAD